VATAIAMAMGRAARRALAPSPARFSPAATIESIFLLVGGFLGGHVGSVVQCRSFREWSRELTLASSPSGIMALTLCARCLLLQTLWFRLLFLVPCRVCIRQCLAFSGSVDMGIQHRRLWREARRPFGGRPPLRRRRAADGAKGGASLAGWVVALLNGQVCFDLQTRGWGGGGCSRKTKRESKGG
jgi:hypothetical protein